MDDLEKRKEIWENIRYSQVINVDDDVDQRQVKKTGSEISGSGESGRGCQENLKDKRP